MLAASVLDTLGFVGLHDQGNRTVLVSVQLDLGDRLVLDAGNSDAKTGVASQWASRCNGP